MSATSKYARLERERRWLVPVLPDLASAVESRLVEDRYLAGTHLRLRQVTRQPGGTAVHKLSQKLRMDPSEVSLSLHTTMYVSPAEHALLSRLPGGELRKVRHLLPHDGLLVAVDVFEGRHAGLVLAEIELPEKRDVPPPYFAGADVTGDELFSGAVLALASDPALASILAEAAARA